MRAKCAQPDHRSRVGPSASAGIVALVAIAATVCMAQGVGAAGLHEAAAGLPGATLRESTSARAVAAAVTAAVRNIVSHDSIGHAPHIECNATLATPLAQPALAFAANHDRVRSHAPPIASRLLNIPPPTI